MELILAVACDDARTRPDGKLDLVGVFNELHAPGFPAAQERMTVVFVLQWERDANGRKPFRADLVDADGRKALTIEGHTDVDTRGGDRAPAQTRLIMPLENVVFPHPGRYEFRIEADGEEHHALSLHLTERPDEG
ncbi:MAG: DUF6941 family protein [Gemmatimonadota bacterium]